ncbi:dipeptidyl aminopeptidase [Bacillus sp. FSL R7-0672]|uniref:dipeptidyl aminopeptidase n=1 Tax=Bacillus sp. FSL R7-0672 TaxID=2921587 RepID=UPI00315B36C2
MAVASAEDKDVALYMSAWIEIIEYEEMPSIHYVALYMSAWIEITIQGLLERFYLVALYLSAWIEIHVVNKFMYCTRCRTLPECAILNDCVLNGYAT